MSASRFPARLRGFVFCLAGAALSALAASPAGAFQIHGIEIAPREQRLLRLEITESYAALPVRAPIRVLRGKGSNPALCLIGGVHGDELNGIEIVRRVLDGADPGALRGTLVGAPIVDVPAFRPGSRYLPDRRDLNRHFAGDPSGSSAARIFSMVAWVPKPGPVSRNRCSFASRPAAGCSSIPNYQVAGVRLVPGGAAEARRKIGVHLVPMTHRPAARR